MAHNKALEPTRLKPRGSASALEAALLTSFQCSVGGQLPSAPFPGRPHPRGLRSPGGFGPDSGSYLNFGGHLPFRQLRPCLLCFQCITLG